MEKEKYRCEITGDEESQVYRLLLRKDRTKYLNHAASNTEIVRHQI